MNRDEALLRLHAIVDGIDRDECAGGWWETGAGATFGSERLAQLESLVHDLTR